MPSKSESQKRLMDWARACKSGKAKNCPRAIKKIGDGMTVDQLKHFNKIEEEGEGMSTLSNTVGVGPVSLPGPGVLGSGDNFDNAESTKKKKRKKLQTYEEYITEINS